jgi:hypothetical protein
MADLGKIRTEHAHDHVTGGVIIVYEYMGNTKKLKIYSFVTWIYGRRLC